MFPLCAMLQCMGSEGGGVPERHVVPQPIAMPDPEFLTHMCLKHLHIVLLHI